MIDVIDDVEDLFSFWLVKNQDDLKREAELRGMHWGEFLVLILDDALEAYKNGRTKFRPW